VGQEWILGIPFHVPRCVGEVWRNELPHSQVSFH
jgi:hypothetical protein